MAEGDLEGYLAPHLRKHAAYLPGEQPEDPKVLKLNTNENPYPPSPGALQAIRAALEKLRTYPPPTASSLCQWIGKAHGWDPEAVVVGNGSDEILAMAVRAFGRPDLPLWAADPSYSLYEVLGKAQGLEVKSLELDKDWNLPKVPPAQGSLAFLAQPNAQTGTAVSLKALESWADGFGGILVVDGAYAGFSDVDDVTWARERPNVLLVRTLSKSHGLAGLRVGYGLCSGRLAQGLHKVRDSYNVGVLAQAGALAALKDTAYTAQTRGKIISERKRMAEELSRRGLAGPSSQANYLLVDFGSLDRAASVLDGLRKRQVLVRHFPAIPRIQGHLRITVGRPQDTDRLLAALDEVLKDEQGAKG